MRIIKKIGEASYQSDLDPNKTVIVKGVSGLKSKPFTKKFKNLKAFEKWSDSEEADDFEIKQVMNEGSSLEEENKQVTELEQFISKNYRGSDKYRGMMFGIDVIGALMNLSDDMVESFLKEMENY